MRTKIRILSLTAAIGLLAALAPSAGAQSVGLPSVPMEIENMEHVANLPQVGGNNLAFFERAQADGTVKRYVVASTMVNGFDIVDVTDPTAPATVGRYVLGGDPAGDPQSAVENSFLGANYHPWVDVNPRRNIVALTIENPGGALRHNGSAGIAFFDISDVTTPTFLGKVLDNGLGGPHTLRIIDDTCVYTSLDTWIVDYSDPSNPEAFRPPPVFKGHEYWPDPNTPGVTWVGTEQVGKWAAWDTSDCRNPKLIDDNFDPTLETAHEAYPAADGSFVGVADFTGEGQGQTECPGGGIYFYDISGKYVPGSTPQDPGRMGVYFAPFSGVREPEQDGPNYASCTMHSWQPNPERMIGLGGLYTGGTYVIDPLHETQPGDGEYTGTHRERDYETTWGKTLGRVRDANDFVNATQWLPFDLQDPEHERLIYVTGWERGLDVYRYTGDIPEKLADLSVSASAAGGTVTGTLERYPLLTSTGWDSIPLAGHTVQVSSGGTTVEVVTAEDGSYSANLGLGAGSHQVTVTWAGDDVFGGETVTRTVTV